jgi:methyltransferase (TIGR00027 family)
MKAGQTSRTAEVVAAMRALDRAINDPPILGDPYAARMIRPAFRALVLNRLIRTIYVRYVSDVRRMMITTSARSRIAEELLTEKKRQGPVQWVLLGAGLDTFAWRHPEHADVPQFEVDHPATQSHKRQLLSRLSLVPPSKHHFVSVELERMRIPDTLVAAGFDPKTPAVFAWLGVTYYLTRAAIEQTLRDVSTIAAPGSALVCDYRLPDHHLDPREVALMRKGDRIFEKWGEPQISKLEVDEWKTLAQETGWTVQADLGRAEIAERFARQCRDGVRPSSNYRILTLGRA